MTAKRWARDGRVAGATARVNSGYAKALRVALQPLGNGHKRTLWVLRYNGKGD
jgi:hypothetical protein